MTNDAVIHRSAPSSALIPTLLKLIEVVEEENAVLQERRITHHAGFTDRKNHCLRELMEDAAEGFLRNVGFIALVLVHHLPVISYKRGS